MTDFTPVPPEQTPVRTNVANWTYSTCRITFTPRADGGYDFTAPTRFDKLFTGIAVERPSWVPTDNRGLEAIGAEDTPDADYGRLLERAQAGLELTQKGERPWRDSNPRSSP